MKKMLIIEGDILIIQDAPYIEDGFYIKVIGKNVSLFEIPLFGGTPIKIGTYETIIEAIRHSETLT